MKGLSSGHVVGKRGSFCCRELPGTGVGAQECNELPALGAIQAHKLSIGEGSGRWRLSRMAPKDRQRPPAGSEERGPDQGVRSRGLTLFWALGFSPRSTESPTRGRLQKETAGNRPLPRTPLRETTCPCWEHRVCTCIGIRVHTCVRACARVCLSTGTRVFVSVHTPACVCARELAGTCTGACMRAGAVCGASTSSVCCLAPTRVPRCVENTPLLPLPSGSPGAFAGFEHPAPA